MNIINQILYYMPVYSSYTYNSGGYGDFIRSLLAVFAYCKEHNIEHKLYIPDHPINDCFVCIRERMNYESVRFIDRCDKTQIIGELEKCRTSDKIIYSNIFDFVNNDILKKHRSEFKLFLKLSEPVKERIDNLKNLINNVKYTVIHIRCGDKFMECNSQCFDDDRIGPDTQLLYDKLNKTVEWLKTKYNLPICLFTDVNSLKHKLCEKYGLLKFDTEIHHTAMMSDRKNAFVDTIAEFELLGEAVAIVKFTNTGFAYWSSFINSVPLFVCNDNMEINKFDDLKY